MTDTQVTWEEPPSRSAELGHVKRFAAQLRTRPGQWARYTNARGEDAVRPQLVGVFKGLGCEATSSGRSVDPGAKTAGMVNVWVRWPEPNGETPAQPAT